LFCLLRSLVSRRWPPCISHVVNLCASWAEPCAHLKSSMPSARLLPAALLAAAVLSASVVTYHSPHCS